MALMGEDGQAPVIRIVKKVKGHGGHHGGAWKVAYADFVTAMMAFFLVMWIIGLDKPTRQAIAQYFNDPRGIQNSGRGGIEPQGHDQPTNGKPQLTPGSREQLEAQFKAVQEEIGKELEKTPEFRGLKDSVQISITDEGLRIELIEKASSLFFDSGSATLKPRTVHLLHAIALQLKKIDNPVVVEGHTDSAPLHGPNGYSNWELSADRANAARRAMEDHGLRENQVIAVRGYADRKLLRPDDPLHFSNRRVSILVPYEQNNQ